MSNAFYDLDEQIRWNQETRKLIQKLFQRIVEMQAMLDKIALERQQNLLDLLHSTHERELGAMSPRAAKRDPLETENRHFLDPRSFISNDGREFLAGEDMSVRRHEVFERSGGFCEEPGCNRQIDEFLPAEHPNALDRKSVV